MNNTTQTTESQKAYELDLRDYGYIILKRKNIIIFSTIVTGFFSFLFATSKTPYYTASSAVKIEESKMAEGLAGYSYGFLSSTYGELQVVKGYNVIEMVAKELGYIDPDLLSAEIRSNETLLSTIKNLQDMISVEFEQGSNIIQISATTDDANLSKKMANSIARNYKVYHRREKIRRLIETKAFIENQIEDTSKSIEIKEIKINQIKNSHQIVTIENEVGIISSRLTRYQNEFEQVSILRQQLETMLNGLNDGTYERRPPSAVTGSLLSRLNSDLLKATLSRKELPIDYTLKHPKVVAIDHSIKSLLSEIKDEVLNQIQSTDEKLNSLQSKVNEYVAKAAGINEIERRLIAFDRDMRINEELLSIFKTKLQEVEIKASEQADEVSVVRMATMPFSPEGQKKQSTVLVGFIIGMLFGIVMAIIRETVDTSIGTIEDVENFLQVPVLGLIPHMGESTSQFSYKEENLPIRKVSDTKLISQYEPRSPQAESYRTLRTNIQFSTIKEGGRVILLTSSYLREGKSTTSANTAVTFAQDGYRTLLIDADMRKSVTHKMFGIDMEIGLSDVILGRMEWRSAIKDITDFMLGEMKLNDIMATPGFENLHILTSGGHPPNPSELLNSHRFSDFLNEVKEEYDIVIIDSPPIMAVTDSTIIAPLSDAIILLHRSGMVPRKVLKRAKSSIENVNVKVAGVILNDVSAKLFPDYAKFAFPYYTNDYIDQLKGWHKLRAKIKRHPYYRQFKSRIHQKIFRVALTILTMLLLGMGVVIQNKL